jgi:predicted transposase/invertase (TIGR01784 family)
MRKKHSDIAKKNKREYTKDEMALRIPLLSDIVFKYIFGSEQSTEILKTFINAVLKDYGYAEITAVRVTNPFNDKTYYDEKYSVIDTRAEDEAGKKYNIEVQLRTQFEYKERSLYYWAKSYSEQLEEAELYGTLKGVVSISILNYIQFPEHIPFHSCFMLRENNNPHDVLTEDCMMHYLEVPKLNVYQLESELEKWIYFLAFCDKEVENMKTLLDYNPAMEAAKKRYDYFIADKQARIAYQQREKFLRDQANYIYTAKMQGLAKGREEGRQEGIEEGKHDQALTTARKLHNMGLATEKIAEATGLTEEEITSALS